MAKGHCPVEPRQSVQFKGGKKRQHKHIHPHTFSF